MSTSVMKNLLQEFGTAIGIPELKSDEENRCNLMFDAVAVSFELGVTNESLFIYSPLGVVPDRDADTFHAALLNANHLLEGTRGSTLSVDPRNKDVVLIREERLDTLRLPRFEIIVEDFVNVAEYWMEQLASGRLDEQTIAPATETLPSHGGMMKV